MRDLAEGLEPGAVEEDAGDVAEEQVVSRVKPVVDLRLELDPVDARPVRRARVLELPAFRGVAQDRVELGHAGRGQAQVVVGARPAVIRPRNGLRRLLLTGTTALLARNPVPPAACVSPVGVSFDPSQRSVSGICAPLGRVLNMTWASEPSPAWAATWGK